MQLLVYAEYPTRRLVYILDILLRDRLGIDYELVPDKEAYLHSDLPGINYSNAPVREEREIHIIPAFLLFRNDLVSLQPDTGLLNEMPVLFPAKKKDVFSFDIFSASFFMLSRYEEYLPFSADRYGRFPASESLAFRENFLEIPVVDLWTDYLRDRIRNVFPQIHLKIREFRYIASYDVDQAFAFRYKPLPRLLGGAMREKNFFLRLRVLMRGEKDPFDTFDRIKKWHRQWGATPYFFFHVGKWDTYDKSIPSRKKIMQFLIRNCDSFGRTGLHPSFRSHRHPEILLEEKRRLEKILGRPVIRSRQHFLLLRLPDTYHQLIDTGILEDYSMGFPDKSGFRAGTSIPYHWFDLLRNEDTPLMIYPFAIMDGTLKDRLGLSPVEAHETLLKYFHMVKNVRGTLITLWHNHSLAETGEWKDWGKMYEEWLEQILT